MNRFSADLAARRVLFLSSLDKVRGGVVISRVGRGTPELPFDNSSCHSPIHHLPDTAWSGPTGIRTLNQRIMLTTSAFAAGRRPCVVWTMPSPCRDRRRGAIMASTPYRALARAWLGVGSPLRAGRSPNLHLTSGRFPNHRPVKVLCSDR